jgi:putative hydrolase of the HAD superfamily
MITHIYFDWSGTIAISHTKIYFKSNNINDKLKMLKPDTISTLKTLVNQGYILGIITNISIPCVLFKKSLKEMGIHKYFKGAIVCSSDCNCRKPSKEIFKIALTKDKVLPENTLMVGNKYKTDIVGAKKMKMNYYLLKTNSLIKVLIA